MKVGLLQPSFSGGGGAEVLAAHQARFLVSRGHEVRLATMGWDAARWAGALSGVDIRLAPKRSPMDVTALGRLAKIRRRGRRLLALLEGCDAVLAHTSPAELMLGEWPGPARKVWYCHEPRRSYHLEGANPSLAARAAAGLPAASKGEMWFRDRLQGRGPGASYLNAELEAVRRLDLVVANSAFTRDNARRIYGADLGIEVIHPMVRFPEPLPRRSGLDRSAPSVLVHSRLDALKNVDTAMRAFAMARKSAPGAVLHVAGEGPDRGILESLSEELGLQGSVRFHGYLPQDALERLYQACDIFLLLPFDEPFGMVFPEAAARGLLLVGPDHGGPAEILEGGALGRVCDAFEPDSAADALCRIFAMPDSEIDSLRERADACCRERFSPQALGLRLESALQGRS